MPDDPGRSPAPHVRAAIAAGRGAGTRGSAQPKGSPFPSTQGRQMAPHVRRAVAGAMQARMPHPAQSGSAAGAVTRPLAPHVAAALRAGAGQARPQRPPMAVRTVQRMEEFEEIEILPSEPVTNVGPELADWEVMSEPDPLDYLAGALIAPVETDLTPGPDNASRWIGSINNTSGKPLNCVLCAILTEAAFRGTLFTAKGNEKVEVGTIPGALTRLTGRGTIGFKVVDSWTAVKGELAGIGSRAIVTGKWAVLGVEHALNIVKTGDDEYELWDGQKGRTRWEAWKLLTPQYMIKTQ